MTTPFTHEMLPADPKAAIRQMKQALRAQIGDVQAVFDRLSATIAARVAEINDLKAQGQPVWPIIPFSELAMGNISDATRAEVKRRGCAVIKGHFHANRRWHGTSRCSTIWTRTILTRCIKDRGIIFSVR